MHLRWTRASAQSRGTLKVLHSDSHHNGVAETNACRCCADVDLLNIFNELLSLTSFTRELRRSRASK